MATPNPRPVPQRTMSNAEKSLSKAAAGPPGVDRSPEQSAITNAMQDARMKGGGVPEGGPGAMAPQHVQGRPMTRENSLFNQALPYQGFDTAGSGMAAPQAVQGAEAVREGRMIAAPQRVADVNVQTHAQGIGGGAQYNPGIGGGNPYDTERVQARDTTQHLQSAFNAQMPMLQRQFEQDVEGHAQSTAALGRTGSGMFDKGLQRIGERNLAARESLLGNLAQQAIQADASRGLQADLANQNVGFQGIALGQQMGQQNANRAMQGDMFDVNNMQRNLDRGLQMAGMNQASQHQNANRGLQGNMFNANIDQQNLARMQGNRQFNVGVNQGNVANQMQAGMFNANIDQQNLNRGALEAQARNAFAAGERDYHRQVERDATNDQWRWANMLGQGFRTGPDNQSPPINQGGLAGALAARG